MPPRRGYPMPDFIRGALNIQAQMRYVLAISFGQRYSTYVSAI